MVRAGAETAPGSSWVHINAELSELIDANRQMESSRWSASALVPPRLPDRTAAHLASHRLCTSRGGRHRHSAASDDSTSLHLLRLSPILAPWRRRLQAFAPLASPRRWWLHILAPGIRVARQACRDGQGRLDGRFGRCRCVRLCTTSWPQGDFGKRRAVSGIDLVLTRFLLC